MAPCAIYRYIIIYPIIANQENDILSISSAIYTYMTALVTILCLIAFMAISSGTWRSWFDSWHTTPLDSQTTICSLHYSCFLGPLSWDPPIQLNLYFSMGCHGASLSCLLLSFTIARYRHLFASFVSLKHAIIILGIYLSKAGFLSLIFLIFFIRRLTIGLFFEVSSLKLLRPLLVLLGFIFTSLRMIFFTLSTHPRFTLPIINLEINSLLKPITYAIFWLVFVLKCLQYFISQIFPLYFEIMTLSFCYYWSLF